MAEDGDEDEEAEEPDEEEEEANGEAEEEREEEEVLPRPPPGPVMRHSLPLVAPAAAPATPVVPNTAFHFPLWHVVALPAEENQFPSDTACWILPRLHQTNLEAVVIDETAVQITPTSRQPRANNVARGTTNGREIAGRHGCLIAPNWEARIVHVQFAVDPHYRLQTGVTLAGRPALELFKYDNYIVIEVPAEKRNGPAKPAISVAM